MNEQEFRTLVGEHVRAGQSVVAAVYAAMAAVQAQTAPRAWVCHRGCSTCCHQMIFVTSGEMGEIQAHLQSLARPLRRAVAARIRKAVAKYRKWFSAIGGSSHPCASDQRWVSAQWEGTPCPLLDARGACSVYPARPIDCRTLHSCTVCQHVAWPEACRMPDDYERWANTMILEHEQRCRGVLAVAPLHHWLWANAQE